MLGFYLDEKGQSYPFQLVNTIILPFVCPQPLCEQCLLFSVIVLTHFVLSGPQKHPDRDWFLLNPDCILYGFHYT